MEFNGDGKVDILSGCYSRNEQPMAGLFWLLAGTGNGKVSQATVVTGSDGKPLIIPASANEFTKSICTQPAAYDWDGDGDLDILTGNFEGGYFLFLNEGSKDKASFNPKPDQILGEDGKPLRLPGAHSGVCPVDWDGDGDPDILSGSESGGVYLAENKSKGKGIPSFSAFRTLIPAVPFDGREISAPPVKTVLPTSPGRDTRVWAVDMNGDGKLDLLIGDTARLVSRASGLSEEEFMNKQKAWQKEMTEVQNEMFKAQNDPSASKDFSQKFSKLYQQRAEFIKEESTGFVWLVLQK